MSISSIDTATSTIQPQQVSAAALKTADSDGDGRQGAAALNDGDAAAQSAASTASRSAGSVDIKA